MTMRITIKNEDTSRTAAIAVFYVASAPADVAGKRMEAPSEAKMLGPGESAEVWIYSGKDFTVSELQEPSE